MKSLDFNKGWNVLGYLGGENNENESWVDMSWIFDVSGWSVNRLKSLATLYTIYRLGPRLCLCKVFQWMCSVFSWRFHIIFWIARICSVHFFSLHLQSIPSLIPALLHFQVSDNSTNSRKRSNKKEKAPNNPNPKKPKTEPVELVVEEPNSNSNSSTASTKKKTNNRKNKESKSKVKLLKSLLWS